MKGRIRLLCPSHFKDVDCCGVEASRNCSDSGLTWTETTGHSDSGAPVMNMMSTCLQRSVVSAVLFITCNTNAYL